MGKQKIINFRPICIAAAFYAVGIVFAYFLLRNVAVAVICISVLAVLSVPAVAFSENKKKSLVSAFCNVFSVGAFMLLVCKYRLHIKRKAFQKNDCRSKWS